MPARPVLPWITPAHKEAERHPPDAGTAIKKDLSHQLSVVECSIL
jgi:hypothetical protein